MKAEFDKEIDSLLRERGQRARVASSERRAEPFAGAHLDADEQSAFAENALPAAARVAYTAHLADCDDCRRSVTQLMLSAGTAAQLNAREIVAATDVQTEVSTRATWRERLAALFAPRASRYAVPALALLLVGAISLIVLTRKSQREVSIAQHNTKEAQTARTTATQTEEHHAQQNDNLAPAPMPDESGTLASNSNATASNPNDSQAREEIAANNTRTETAPPVSVAPLNDSAADAPPPPAPATVGSGAVATAPAMPEKALPPQPTPPPPPFASDGVTAASEQEAKTKSDNSSAALRRLEQRNSDFENRQYENRQQRERISGPRRNEQVQNRRAPDTNNTSDRADERSGELAASTAARSPASRRAQTGEAERDKGEKRAKEESEPVGGGRAAKSAAETRSVAGRRFRRQGDAWVDTAYAAGQSYTVVRRNSEQFRALAADEPQLRRIADALGGDITVVWKGRAYRIK